VSPVDDPPSLSDPVLDPVSGDETTLFTFSIVLMDIDSAEPTDAKVYVGTGSFDLTTVSGDNTTGMVLEWKSTLDPGDYDHYFLVDGTRYPESDSIDGPSVEERMVPYLKEGEVDADIGGLSTEFYFDVTWVGPNGEVPDGVNLIVDEDTYPLAKNSGNAKTGIDYDGYLTLGEGRHSYYFEAILGSSAYRFPDRNRIDGPSVYPPELKDWGYIRIGESGERVLYGFWAHFQYIADVYPDTARITLNGQEYDMTSFTGSPILGMNYTIELSLEEDTYQVMFEFESDGVTLAENESFVAKLDEVIPPSGHDTEDAPKRSNANVLIIVIAVILILGVLVAIFGLFMRKNRIRKEDSEEIDWEK
jgi:hypothetical protein